MALWAKGHKMRTGKPLPDSARGRIAGTIKAMLADFPADDLVAAVGRWFGADRESFGIALFKHRLEDGDAELTGRRTTKAGPRGPGPGRGVQMAPGALAEIERMTMQFEASALEVSHGCDHEQTN